MLPTAQSLVMDMLSTTRGRAMPVRALVAVAAVFDITENNLRVTLARLLAGGRLERDERGEYRLAECTRALQEQVATWTHLNERTVPWTEGWLGVHTGGLPRAKRDVQRRGRGLELLGFRTLVPDLWLRPDNLVGGVTVARRRLSGLGLEPEAPAFTLGSLDVETEARARGLWDVAALRAAYREATVALVASAASLPKTVRKPALVETFVLGNRAIRLLVRDPLLPEAIMPTDERQALMRTMREYDRLGKKLWAAFFREHGAPAQESLLPFRSVEAAAPLATTLEST